MKRLIIITSIIMLIFGMTATVFADVWVEGYYKDDGTYVQGHWRSDPDGNFWNNYSTKGNINPYTGEVGTRTYESYLKDKYGFSNIYNNYDLNEDSFYDFERIYDETYYGSDYDW